MITTVAKGACPLAN